MANFTLTQAEHLFYGEVLAPGQTRRGLSAEEYKARIVQMRTTLNWNEATTVGYAIGHLRDEAFNWFEKGLKLRRPALRAQAMGNPAANVPGDLAVFWQLFEAEWFSIVSLSDVSNEWSQLHRADGESPMLFFRRVERAMSELVDVMPRADLAVTAAEVAAIQAAIGAAGDALHTAGGGPAGHAAQAVVTARALVTTSLDAYVVRILELQTAAVVSQVTAKVLAAGVRNQKIRELIRKEDTATLDLHTLAEKVRKAEKEFDPGFWKKKPVTPFGFAAPVGEADNMDDKQDAGAVKKAPAGFTKKGKEGKKLRKKYDFSKPPGADVGPCWRCHTKGHWSRQCPTLTQGPVSQQQQHQQQQQLFPPQPSQQPSQQQAPIGGSGAGLSWFGAASGYGEQAAVGVSVDHLDWFAAEGHAEGKA